MEEERTDVGTGETGDGGDQSAHEECEVVPRCNSMLQASNISVKSVIKKVRTPYPESTREKGDSSNTITRFLALSCDAFIHTFPQPNIRLHVPRVQKNFEVIRELDLEHFDIGSSVPQGVPRSRKAGESESGEDTCAFGQCPDGVVFRTFEGTEDLEQDEAIIITPLASGTHDHWDEI